MKFWSELDWGNWLYGIFAGGIGGGASAISSGIGVATIDPKDFAIGSTNSVEAMAVTFAISFVLSVAFYLKQNPMPKIKTVTTVQKVELQSDPPAKVTTTVQETKISTEQPAAPTK